MGQIACVYDLGGHLITEATAATAVKLGEYIWLPSSDLVRRSLGEGGNNPVDLSLAVIDVANNTISYVRADHLGRPIRMIDAANSRIRKHSPITKTPPPEGMALQTEHKRSLKVVAGAGNHRQLTITCEV